MSKEKLANRTPETHKHKELKDFVIADEAMLLTLDIIEGDRVISVVKRSPIDISGLTSQEIAQKLPSDVIAFIPQKIAKGKVSINGQDISMKSEEPLERSKSTYWIDGEVYTVKEIARKGLKGLYLKDDIIAQTIVEQRDKNEKFVRIRHGGWQPFKSNDFVVSSQATTEDKK